MTNQTRHFVLTGDGIREFQPDDAARIAAGNGSLPEFADSRVRYLQLMLEDEGSNEIKIQASGTCIEFNHDGQLCSAGAPENDDEQITSFEYDACVQWTLRELQLDAKATFH